MKSRPFSNRFLLAALLVPFFSTAHAASITWGSATTMAGDTADVSTTGTRVFAYNWANATQTVNGVPFTAPGSGVTMANGSVNTSAFSSPSGAAFTSAYKAILPGAYSNNSTPSTGFTVTLNNLVVGRSYQVQCWSEDARAGFGSRTTTITSVGGNSVTLQMNTTNSAGTPGQFGLGTFTADASTQLITVTGNAEAHLTALQLRDTSPPVVKAATGTDLADIASWTGGLPSASLPANWDGTSLGAGLTLNSDQTWTGIGVTGALGDIGISGSGTLTLGNGGVSISGANMTLSNPVALGAAQTWTVASGKSLAFGNSVTGNFAPTVSGAGTVQLNASGSLNNGASGLNISGASTVRLNGGDITTSGNVSIGNSATDTCTFQMDGVSTYTQTAGSFTLGSTAGSVNIFNQTGGTFTFSGGGNLIMDNNAGTDTVNFSGGIFNQTGTGALQMTQRGTGIVNISSTADVTTPRVALVGWTTSGSAGTLNLNGGMLTTPMIAKTVSGQTGSGTATFNFNGGLLKSNADNATYMTGLTTVNIRNGGAIIDDGGFAINIDQALKHSAIGGDNATDGGLTKSGAGTLTLSGANTYTGATAVNKGTLAMGTGGSLATSPSITLASGTTLDASSAPAGTLTLASGQTLAGSGTVLGIVNSVSGSTVSPGIVGIGTLAVDGTLNLAGNTNIDVNKSGGITNDQIAGIGTVTLGGTLTINATGTALALNDEIQILANSGGTSGAFTGVIVLPALPTGLSIDTSNLAVNGKVRVVNRLSTPLVSIAGGNYIGAQNVTLTADSGTTIYYTIDGSDPASSATSGPTPVIVNVPTNSYHFTIRAIAKKSGQTSSQPSSAVYNTVTTPTWIANADGYWSDLQPLDAANWQSTVVAGGAGVTADFSTLQLTQDTKVTLDGSRSIGTMKFGDAAASPQFQWSLESTGGSVLTLAGGASQPVIQVNNLSASIATSMAGIQGFEKTGNGTLKLATANGYSGTTTVSTGTLEVVQGASIASASGIDIAANALLQFTTDTGSRTVGSAVSGAGNVLLTQGTAPDGGNGTYVTLSGTWASFTGTLSLANTRIDSVQNVADLSAVNLVVNDGSQIFANDGGTANFGAQSITIAGRGHNSSGGTGPLGALRIDNNHHYTGPVTLAANAAIGNATYTGASYVDGNISGNHELEIIPRYGNWNTKVYLAGNNTYGSTRVTGGSAAPYSGAIGELIANSATGLSSGPVVVDGGRLTLNGYSFSIANLSSTASGGTVQNGHATTASTLTVGTDGTATIYGGTLADGAAASLALKKMGGGALTLTNTNTYTGATTVDAGTLLVNGEGSLAAGSAVAVNNAATLGGTGSVNGSVILASTATISPGNAGAGPLNTGSLALGGTYKCEIDGANADSIQVNGALNLTGSTLDVHLLAGGFTAPHYVIATYITRTGTLPNPTGYTVKYDQGAGTNEIWLVKSGGYSDWATANGVTGGINGDFDNDGVSNGIEYFMSQPGTGFTALPGVVTNAGVRSVTWTQGNDYTGSYGTDFVVETSTTLNGDWVKETQTPAPGGTVTITGTSVTYTFPAGPVKNFARLQVTGP